MACALPSGRGAAIDVFRADIEARAPLRLRGPSTKTPSRPASATAAASSPGSSRTSGAPAPAARSARRSSAASSRTSSTPASRARSPLCGGAGPSRRPTRRARPRRRSRSTPSGASPAPGPPARPGGTRSTGTSTRRSTRAAASGRSRIFSPRPAGPSCARRAPRILDLDPWEETYLYLRSKFRLLPRDLNLHPTQYKTPLNTPVRLDYLRPKFVKF